MPLRAPFSRIAPLLSVAFLPATLLAQEGRQAKIDEALSAAPASVTRGATVMDWEGDVLRQGDNGWTCLPRLPGSTGPNPMCMDGPWMEWAHAFQQGTEPPVSGMGISYMLAGDAPVNNDDPFDQTRDPGEVWVDAGSHIMIVLPDRSLLEGLPTDPTTGGPWVMWKGTPYVHVMVPLTDEVEVR